MQHTYVAIMAGGIGSRFWPQSRVNQPKQFLDVLGTGQSLIQMTFERFRKMVPAEQIMVVTNKQYADLCKEHLPEIPEKNILVEPYRRNTGPCVAYFSWKVAQLNPYANLIIAPSDHMITQPDVFIEKIKEGLDFIEGSDTLLTLGIRPTRPDTGYGYIQFLEEDYQGDIYRVKTFTEKPNAEIAQHFINSGDYLWNAGIFLWNAQSILQAFKEHSIEISSVFDETPEKFNTAEEAAYIEWVYSQCPNISVDNAIMEKAQNIFVLPSSFGWSDLGTWTSVWDNADKDEQENFIDGEQIMTFDVKNTLIKSPKGKMVVVQGLEDYCVIDTPDALLIYHKDQEVQLKAIHSKIKEETGDQYL